jgi:hypothetical protein
MAPVGPHPSHIEVAKPYVLQGRIAQSLREVGMSDAKDDAVRLQGVAWLDQTRRALQLPIRTFNTACLLPQVSPAPCRLGLQLGRRRRCRPLHCLQDRGHAQEEPRYSMRPLEPQGRPPGRPQQRRCALRNPLEANHWSRAPHARERRLRLP